MSEKPTEAEGLPKRWSARRKSEVVLRLLRGEDIGEVSREIRVPPTELECWRRKFLEGACEGLKTKIVEVERRPLAEYAKIAGGVP